MLNKTHAQNVKNKILHFCEPKEVFRKIPLHQLENYVELLNMPALHTILADEDLMHTVEVFFENNLNLSVTSKNAFMHRNTLIYRLEKIRREIGLNLKVFEEARIFKNIMLIAAILEEKEDEQK
jgi:DNA-binding PucR family transcriptional regulator